MNQDFAEGQWYRGFVYDEGGECVGGFDIVASDGHEAAELVDGIVEFFGGRSTVEYRGTQVALWAKKDLEFGVSAQFRYIFGYGREIFSDGKLSVEALDLAGIRSRANTGTRIRRSGSE